MLPVRLLACVALTGLPIGGCATTAGGVTSAEQVHHVASVDVVQHDAKAPAAFAEGLRVALLREAALYGQAGAPLALKVDLDRVHLKNPVLALTLGDDNQAKGRVAVLDATTGRQAGTFAVSVNADRTGLGTDVASFVALSVAGAFDPTGLVDAGSMAAEAGSAQLNRGGTEAGMSVNFARETLRMTFGDAKAKAAHGARK
jgi:hypothetical protein